MISYTYLYMGQLSICSADSLWHTDYMWVHLLRLYMNTVQWFDYMYVLKLQPDDIHKLNRSPKFNQAFNDYDYCQGH